MRAGEADHAYYQCRDLSRRGLDVHFLTSQSSRLNRDELVTRSSSDAGLLMGRFADHGLVRLMIALRRANVLEIDTGLMSCRVLGRRVEATMLQSLLERRQALGCISVPGRYIPTVKNPMAKEVFPKIGFDLVEASGGSSVWEFDLTVQPPFKSEYIESVES